MFTWLNKQGVKSSNGFVLQSVHRFHYHYIENERRMQVDVEPLTDQEGNYSEIIYLGSLKKWLAPFEQDQVSEETTEEIRENIAEALHFMGIKHSFQ